MITHREPAKTVYSPHPLLGALLTHTFGDWRLASLDPSGWTSTRGAVFDIKCVHCKRRSQGSAEGLLKGARCGCRGSVIRSVVVNGVEDAATLRRRVYGRVRDWKLQGGHTWNSNNDAVDWVLKNMNLPPLEEFSQWCFSRPDATRQWAPDNIELLPKTLVRKNCGRARIAAMERAMEAQIAERMKGE